MKVGIYVGGRRPHRHYRNSGYRNSGGSNGGGGSSASPKGKIIFGFISILLALAMGFLSYMEETKANNYIKVNGVVVDHYTRYDNDGQSYGEIAEYEVNGHRYECSASSSSSFPKSIGSSIEVRYDESNPSACFVGSKSQNIIIYIACGAFVIAGICLIASGIKKKNSL